MKIQTAIPAAFIALLFAGCSVFSGKTSQDSVVLPMGERVTLTDGCLVYALPLTVFEFEISAEKRTEIPGPYAYYAAEMLGLDRVITTQAEKWRLAGIRLNTADEIDPSQYYIIQGTTLMQTNMLALRKSGLVLDINPGIYDHTVNPAMQKEGDFSGLLFPDRGAYKYGTTKTDTAYRVVKVDTAFIRVPYLVQKKKGMTTEEQAREAADRLLELREGRHMILTGETNVFPQDGAAIDEINRLEREYTALFAGKTWTEIRKYSIWVTPDLSMAGRMTTVFTFSEAGGVDLSAGANGIAVEMQIIPSGKTGELNLVVRPESPDKKTSPGDRLYYRIPDVADITVSMGDERLLTDRRLVYQFGKKVALPSNFIIGR